MGRVQAVLLIPDMKNDRKMFDALMGPGFCGTRPPKAMPYGGRIGSSSQGYSFPDGPAVWISWSYSGNMWKKYHAMGGGALVLAWDNKPVPEGMDRAFRVQYEIMGKKPGWNCVSTNYGSTALSILNSAKHMERNGLGRTALLNVNGGEIK